MPERTVLVAPRRIERPGDVRFFAPPVEALDVVMDLSRVEWIAPVGVVGLLALAHRAELSGASLEFHSPHQAEVRDFPDDAGFLAALEQRGARINPGVRRSVGAGPIRPGLPATLVSTEWEMEQAAIALEDILLSVRAPAQVLQSVYLVMTELTNNAWQHGLGCYVMAQTHTGARSGQPGLELAIADLGPGFAATLATHGPQSEVDALLMACEDRITGTGDPGRGFGLGFVMSSIDGYPGRASLSIISKDGWMERRDGGFHCYDGPNCHDVFVTGYFPFNGVL